MNTQRMIILSVLCWFIFMLSPICVANTPLSNLTLTGASNTLQSGATFTVNSGATFTFASGSTVNFNGTVGASQFPSIGLGVAASTPLITGSFGSGIGLISATQGSSETSGVNLIDVATTWNNASNTPTALKLNVTDTASNAGSLLLDFQIGGTSKWTIKKDGTLTNGILPIARISATGTPSSTTFLEGDGKWVTPTFSGSSGSIIVNGTAGGGYLELDTQSADVSAPGLNNLRLYSDSNGYLAINQNSGLIARISPSLLTAGRLYFLPDTAGTLQVAQTSALNYGIMNGANLDTIAGLSSSGAITQTGTGTYANRTMTGGTGITVTNGTGVAGNPTFAINQAFSPTWTGTHAFQGNAVVINSATVPANNPSPPAGTLLHLTGADSTFPTVMIDGFAGHGELYFRRADGTSASPSAIQNADALGSWSCFGYGSSAYSTKSAAVTFEATENWTNSSHGTEIIFNTTPNSGGSLTTALTVGQDQSITQAGPTYYSHGVNTQTGSTYTITSSDSFVVANASGTQTETLGSPSTGRVLWLRTITANAVVSDSSNVIPLAGGSAGTAILAATAGKWAMLVYDGSSWEIFAAN